MLFIFFYIILSISARILFLNNPLGLSFFILLFRIILSLNIGFISYSWFSFIIFLIYIRGIIVIFSYFVVLQPNQLYVFFSFFFFFFLIFLIVLFYINIIGIYKFKFYNWITSSLYILSNRVILLFIGLILLLILLSIVKVTFINRSSLRPFN